MIVLTGPVTDDPRDFTVPNPTHTCHLKAVTLRAPHLPGAICPSPPTLMLMAWHLLPALLGSALGVAGASPGTVTVLSGGPDTETCLL